MPTINDVAALAKVSAMTVSRVINGEGNVRPNTKEVVLQAIAQLRFAPNRAAQALAGASQIKIGLLYSNPSAGYLSEFLVGGLDQASHGNVLLVIEKCDSTEEEAQTVDRLLAGGVEGIILPPPLCDSLSLIDILAARNIPAVAVATGREADTMSIVSIDDHQAAFEMTQHIARLGHQRIGFICGNPNQTASGKRLEGYREAMAQAGFPASDDLIAQGMFTYRSGLDAAEQLLELADPPSAIFASNDDMAAATVAVAHRRGLDVPGDLTVCGFDDTSLATTIWPELTTVRQPIAEMSRAAINELAEEIRRHRGREPARHQQIRLDYAVIRRQSDAAPRRRPKARPV